MKRKRNDRSRTKLVQPRGKFRDMFIQIKVQKQKARENESPFARLMREAHWSKGGHGPDDDT